MKITVNEKLLSEATKTRKVLPPAELDKIARDVFRGLFGPEAQAKRYDEDADSIVYTVSGIAEPLVDEGEVDRAVKSAHLSLADLDTVPVYEPTRKGNALSSLELRPATLSNLRSAADACLSSSSFGYYMGDKEAPVGMDASTLLRQAVAEYCKENEVPYELSVGELFELASPSQIKDSLAQLEEYLIGQQEVQKQPQSAKRSHARASSGVYTVELGVFGFYGSSARDAYRIKAPDMLTAVRAFVGETGGFGATSVPDPLYVAPSAEELQALKSRPDFDKRYVFKSLEALFEREKKDAEHDAYERAVIRVEGGGEDGFYDSSADDAYAIGDWGDDGKIEVHTYKIDASKA